MGVFDASIHGPRFLYLWVDLDRVGADFRVFEILGGAGDISNSISMPNYCDGPYIPLLLCANKVLSAWTEVWTST